MEKDRNALEVKNYQAYDTPLYFDYNPFEIFCIP